MKNKLLAKDKEAFRFFVEEHTLAETAEYFGLSYSYVKNYVGNHKLKHKPSEKLHGFSGTRLYTIYRGMLSRCYNKNHIYYSSYGGRGIEVCNLWKNDKKAFFSWALNNGYKQNLEIDRIDVNKNYSPDNCRFVDKTINQNNRRCNRKYKGVAIGLICAVMECNPLRLKENVVYKRLTGDNGRLRQWGIIEALATPVNNIKGSHKILPVDLEAKVIVEKGLAKHFPCTL